jgi:TolA-binding protein
MNCEQCREHLLGFAWDELPPQLQHEVADALARCPDCQQELAHIQRVRAAWQDAAPAQELSHLTRANLLRQARLHADTLQHHSPWARLSSWLIHPAFASVAAVAILILVALLFTQQDHEQSAPSMAAAPAAENMKREDALAAAPAAAPPAAKPANPLEGQLLAQRDEDDDAPTPEPAAKARAESPAPQERKLALRADKALALEEAAPTVDRGLSYANLPDNDAAADNKSAPAPTVAELEKAQGESAPLSRNAIGKGAEAAADAQQENWTSKQSTLNNSGSFAGRSGGSGVADSLNSGAPGNSASPPADAPQPTPPPQERFQQGMSRFNRADYAGAIEDFNAFMNEAPASSDYHALALYHRGMSEHRQSNYAAAVASFRRVLADHPRSEKRDEARYWLAVSLQKLNPDDPEARTILTDLSQGRSGVAAQARQDLERAYGRQRRAEPKPAKTKKDDAYDYPAEAKEPAEHKSAE